MQTHFGRNLLLAALAAGTLAGPAHATVLCTRRAANGQAVDGATVKLRTACRDNEIALDAAALGLRTGIGTVTVRAGNTVSTNGGVSVLANCAAGEVATGGGALATGASGGLAVLRSSRPDPDDPGVTPIAWRTTVVNTASTGTITATTYVVCAAE